MVSLPVLTRPAVLRSTIGHTALTLTRKLTMNAVLPVCLMVAHASAVANAALVSPPMAMESSLLSSQFNWSAIATQPDLHYQPCYDGFECARLLLPLDYHNSSNPHNISLAVIRLPATVAEGHPSHGGSIIVNPGGPGGSGVQYALSVARRLQDGLSQEGGKQFEIVSFDPRGILYSKPNLYCFATPFDAQIWGHEKLAKGSLDEGELALEWQWQFELARGRVCETSEGGRWHDETDIRRYVSTVFVARDMLELARAIDIRKMALLRSTGRAQAPIQPDNVPKIQYYGQSYGTFLGQLFASMYPESVDRMILDGNIDGDNWVSAHEYSVDDAEAIRAYFFEACYAAWRQCPFWSLTDDSAQDQEARYTEIKAKLAQRPALITRDGRTTLLTPDRLEKAFFTASYQPAELFPRFAESLLSLYLHLEYGDPLDHSDVFWEAPSPTFEDFASEELAHVVQNDEIAAFVHCGDGPDLTDHNISSFKWHLGDLVSKFPHVAAEQASYKLPCWTMSSTLRTVWRYAGPFGSDQTPPVLFLNNRLDAATPAKSARKMAGRFVGSKLVVSGNFGHVALWKGGDCVWEHARRYMQDGSLPEEEEGWCDGTHEPFESAERDLRVSSSNGEASGRPR